MQLLPKCPEGFRRLSIVLAIIAFAGLFSYWTNRYIQGINTSRNSCIEAYLPADERCYAPDYNGEIKACTDRVSQEMASCIAVQSPSQEVRLASYGLFALGALVGGYLAMLGSRTIGWVALGFEKGDPRGA